MMETLNELVGRLQRHPHVVGRVEYGSRAYTDTASKGDYDLLALFSDDRPRVESLHFYVGGLPIDPNLRYLEDWQTGRLQSSFDRVFVQGRLMYEATAAVAVVLERLRRARARPVRTSPRLATVKNMCSTK